MSELVMILVFFTSIGLLPIIGIIGNARNPRDQRQNQKSGSIGRFGNFGEDVAGSPAPLELQTAQNETDKIEESAGQAV
jgi:hypothetical protein